MQNHFQYFTSPITDIALPHKFTFPFYYEPHPLALIAANELQNYLKTQNDFEHDFGSVAQDGSQGVGKMFGVLVVQNEKNELGYLCAVSGKLAESNEHKMFVPPVYDMLQKNSFYLSEVADLKKHSKRLLELEQNPAYLNALKTYKIENKKGAIDIREKKDALKAAKQERDKKRIVGKRSLTDLAYQQLEQELSQESLAEKHFLNNVKRYYHHTLEPLRKEIATFESEINRLREARKNKSIALQQFISEQYHFLNSKKEVKNLSQLFEDTAVENIPAGAGECAAPKLLQYAFLNQLKPIAMAEFWWGISPNQEIRRHQNFYPACQGKCKPILAHMLNGIEMDKNPLLENPAIGKEFEIIFEDDEIIVIDKPAEFLSVPGLYIQDSVYTRIKQSIKDISGPIVVHRLDMATSGLLVLAKTKRVHKFLQAQFINRTVHKRYTALLDGIVKEDKGTIALPLRVDLDDRPRQLVCETYGRPAVTHWEVVERKDGKTKVHFYPVSGRTHQLRVHAAHKLGLNIPIVGDDLYGNKADRLYLHSDSLSFMHPNTRDKMDFHQPAPF